MEALIRQVCRLTLQPTHGQARLYGGSTNATSFSVFGAGPVVVPSKSKKGYINHHPIETKKAVNLLTRLRCVDNSAIGKQTMAEGKPPKVIHVYSNTKRGVLGDRVLMTMKGEMRRGIVVGVKKRQGPLIPRFDTNNVVLIDDTGSPLGTRIHVPIPMLLRKLLKARALREGNRIDYSKLLAIAPRFI